jgi:4-azaleucine resistance transporter AzlC
MHSRTSEFLSGVKAELPIMLGVIPFGMIYGVLALGAGLPAHAAQAMSSIVFAGSAQFVAAQLFASGAPGLVIVLTAFVVNLRHVLYSASVAPHLKHLDSKWKGLLAYLLTDEAYAVVIMRYNRDAAYPAAPPNRHWYFLGAGLTLWTTWQASTAVGILLGAQIPPGWALDFTLALTFIALVVPALDGRPSVAAALAAGTVAVLAAIFGIAAGLAVEAQPATKQDEQVRTT